MGGGREGEALFAPGELAGYAAYARSAVGRRAVLACTALALCVGAAVAGAWLLPPSYEASATLLVLPAETGGYSPRQADTEAAAIAATIHRRDQLEKLSRRLGLAEHWLQTRPLLPRLRSELQARLGGDGPAEDAQQTVLALLEKKLEVESENGQVVVRAYWHDPRMAQAIAEVAQEQLLTVRRESELAASQRTSEAVRAQLPDAEGRIAQAVASLEAANQSRRRGAKASSVGALQAEGRFRDLPDANLAKLRLQLIARRKQLDDLEKSRRTRLAELNAQLAEARATYAPSHPVMAALEEKRAVLQRGAPELEAARAQEQQLLSEFVQGGGKEIDLSEHPASAWPTDLDANNPGAELARARLSLELGRYGTLQGELAEAELAKAHALASFEQRHLLITPPQLPKGRLGPPRWALVLGGLLLGLGVAVLAATFAELAAGTILQRWQVERGLQLPVLAEVKR